MSPKVSGVSVSCVRILGGLSGAESAALSLSSAEARSGYTPGQLGCGSDVSGCAPDVQDMKQGFPVIYILLFDVLNSNTCSLIILVTYLGLKVRLKMRLRGQASQMPLAQPRWRRRPGERLAQRSRSPSEAS